MVDQMFDWLREARLMKTFRLLRGHADLYERLSFPGRYAAIGKAHSSLFFGEKTNQVRFFPKSERQPPQLRRLRKSDRLRSAQFIQRLVAFVGVAECASVEPF